MTVITHEQIEWLVTAAREVRAHAYVPYSGFHVGAAVLVQGDRIVTGVNVENASYPLSVCAERSAIGSAVSLGSPTLTAIAVVADADEPTAPCGGCRQVLLEFGAVDTPVICEGAGGTRVSYALADLLPHPFTLDR